MKTAGAGVFPRHETGTKPLRKVANNHRYTSTGERYSDALDVGPGIGRQGADLDCQPEPRTELAESVAGQAFPGTAATASP
jgi:hypothetical protein